MEVYFSVWILMAVSPCIQSTETVTLTASEGSFSVVHENSNKKVKKQWLIKVPNGRVELMFDDKFDVGVSDPRCDQNYVRVFDGNTTDIELMRFRHCGSSPPHKIISSSNIFLVEFHADKMEDEKGFTATYREIQDTEMEYQIYRHALSWEDAFAKCRENNGYLARASIRRDKQRLQHIRANEEVWVGTYTTAWLWTRECWEYTPESTDRAFTISRNAATVCQQRCGTDQVWLQHDTCLCNITLRIALLAPYRKCNMSCQGDIKDVCGGDDVFMRYEKWNGQYPVITGISRPDNCIALSLSDNPTWDTVRCNNRYQTFCKDTAGDMATTTNTFSELDLSGEDTMRYGKAVTACLGDKKMIADIVDISKVENEVQDKSRGIWVALRRRRASVGENTVSVTVEKAYNSCYYLVLNDKQELTTYVGNCSQQKPYYCRISNIIQRFGPTTGTKLPENATGTNKITETTIDLQYKHSVDVTIMSHSTTSTGIIDDEADAKFPIILVSVLVVTGLVVLSVVVVIVGIRHRKKQNLRMQEANNERYESILQTNRQDHSYAETTFHGNANIRDNRDSDDYVLPG